MLTRGTSDDDTAGSRKGRRFGMAKTTYLIMIGCLFALSACGGSAPSGQAVTKAEDVAGIWHRTQDWRGIRGGQQLYIRLTLDGTMALSPVPDKWSQPVASYEFGFEGSQFSLEETHGRRLFGERDSCLDQGYPTAMYEIRLLSNGNLQFAQAQDQCVDRRQILADVEWEPV
jgi:hypothetical protein